MNKLNIKRIIRKMTEYTTPFICPIYGIEDKTYGEQVGSGTLVNINKKTYIITAAHVIKRINNNFNGCGVSFYSNDSIIKIGPTCRLSFNLDIAMIPMDISQLKCKPFYCNINNCNCENIENDILYIHGNPGVRSRFIVLDNAIHTESLPYSTGIGKSSYHWFDKSLHIALDYPSNIETIGGSFISLPDPHGLSGTGVWKLNISIGDNPNKWGPEKSQLIGVIHTWDQKCSSLIATKIETIKQKV